MTHPTQPLADGQPAPAGLTVTADVPTDGDAHTPGTATQPPEATADGTGDALQLPAVAADAPHAPAQLWPQDVIAIQNAEAAQFRGSPRSLHRLARDALQSISASPTREPVVLDGVFPWVQYVAAHKHAFDNIGPGITRAMAIWKPRTNDNNRGGAERLDFHFFREDGTVCRVHPGTRRKDDARLVFERAQ